MFPKRKGEKIVIKKTNLVLRHLNVSSHASSKVGALRFVTTVIISIFRN